MTAVKRRTATVTGPNGVVEDHPTATSTGLSTGSSHRQDSSPSSTLSSQSCTSSSVCAAASTTPLSYKVCHGSVFELKLSSNDEEDNEKSNPKHRFLSFLRHVRLWLYRIPSLKSLWRQSNSKQRCCSLVVTITIVLTLQQFSFFSLSKDAAWSSMATDTAMVLRKQFHLWSFLPKESSSSSLTEQESFRYWIPTVNAPYGLPKEQNDQDEFRTTVDMATSVIKPNESSTRSDVTQLWVSDLEDIDGIAVDSQNNNMIMLWTYPISPPKPMWRQLFSHSMEINPLKDPPIQLTVICSYQVCLDAATEAARELRSETLDSTKAQVTFEIHRINLPKLIQKARGKIAVSKESVKQENLQYTQLASFQRFVEYQYWFKLQYRNDFSHHVQSVAAMILLYNCDSNNSNSASDQQQTTDCCIYANSTLEKICSKQIGTDDIFRNYLPGQEKYNDISNDDQTSATKKIPIHETSSESFAEQQLMMPPRFGILDYQGRVEVVPVANSGDELQTFPGLQFLPYLESSFWSDQVRKDIDVHEENILNEYSFNENNTNITMLRHRIRNIQPGYVDRDFGLPFAGRHVDFMFANAWWGFASAFPPSSSVQMLWSSMHASADFLNVISRNDHYWRGYVHQHGPIGARDNNTIQFLKQRGIPAYLSSCFTQMLLGPSLFRRREFSSSETSVGRTNRTMVVVVDVDESLLPQSVKERAHFFGANVNEKNKNSRQARYEHAHRLVKIYAEQAKVVITSRIHAALPASVQGVPVIFVHPQEEADLPGGGGGRTKGIADLFHEYWPMPSKGTRRKIKKGMRAPHRHKKWGFDLDHMEANPGVHTQDRYRASFWNLIKTRGPTWYVDTAYIFGLIPLKRLGEGVPSDHKFVQGDDDIHGLFHFIFTTPATSLTWRVQRAIEAVYYHHPNAKVIVHSNTLPSAGTRLDIFTEVGYDFTIQPYSIEQLLRECEVVTLKDTNNFLNLLTERRKNARYWYSHETDLVRMLLMEKFGGVYLDTDQHLVRSIPKSFTNVLGYQDRQKHLVNGAVMIFNPKNAFIRACIREGLHRLVYAYDDSIWAIVGPDLLTYMWKKKFQPSFVTSVYRRLRSIFSSPFNVQGRQFFPVRVVSYEAFYPFHWSEVDRCFYVNSRPEDPGSQDKSHSVGHVVDLSSTYTVHLNTKQTARFQSTLKGSLCDHILHDYCIFCDEVYTRTISE